MDAEHGDHDDQDEINGDGPAELALLDALTQALLEPVPEPSADRVAAVRAAMEQRNAAAASTTMTTSSTTTATTTSASAPTIASAATLATARRRPAPWLLAVAASTVLVASLTAGFLAGRRSSDGDLLAGGVTEFVETLTAPSGPAQADVTGVLTGIGRVVQIRTDELPILPKGEFYEVWFVAADDAPGALNRISAGTFHPDENGRTAVDLAAAVDPVLFPTLSVTAEPGDGNPLPTGPEVLRTDIVIID